ncbi:unnamed protein product [Diatraea saccharalis]|uniref:Uncharacterized protein n=1 Tax=Diatraea saccharalis TaxID=40085 RepID=A0A9N9WEJ7_9NEOP|nr:unnamed protein product [Diatraea saccharalis]
MYNWRLLLFAFFAVFKPIASSAERNLVDGRQQCCDHRLSRDTARLNGNNPFEFSAENRHLKERRYIREVRRDDFRNGHYAMISATANSFHDAQERQVIRNSDFRTRSAATTFRLMINRRVPIEIRDSRIRNIETDLEKRNFASYLNSKIGTSDERVIRTLENTVKHRKREINQRESIRHMLNDIAATRRLFMELQPSVQNGQRIQTERVVRREISVARANMRYQYSTQRSTRSLDRFTRQKVEHMQLSTENFRVTNGERNIRSEFQRVRSVEGKRTEISERERVNGDRKLTTRFLSRHRDDKERKNRIAIVSNDNRRRDTRRVIRESKEHAVPLDTVEIMHVDVNNERNIARSVRVISRLIVLPQEQRETRANTRDNFRFIVREEERRARSYSAPRMLTSRHDDRERTILNIRDREVHENRQNSRDRRYSENMRTFRTLSWETNYERRNMGSRQDNSRSSEVSRQQDELRERRYLNERARSSERERISRDAQRRTGQMAVNLYQERQSRDIKRGSDLRRIVDYRTVKSASKTMEDENNEFIGTNWQYLIYTMQGIYLSFILGTSLQKLVKVD